MDIGIGVVDEHARLCVTGRVDVEVVASRPAMQPPTYSPSFWKSMG